MGLRNAKLDANTTFAGSGAKLRFYTAPQPATGGAATTLLSEHLCGSPFAPAAASASLSPTLPAASTGVATGTAAWARLVKADGTTHVMDMTVGTAGADVILASTEITNGGAVTIQSWVINGNNA